MASDEEYLDSLLKSMTEQEPPQRSMDDLLKSMNTDTAENKEFSLSSNDLADMLDKLEESDTALPVIEEIQDDTSMGSFDAPVFQDLDEAQVSVIDKISPEELAEREMMPDPYINEDIENMDVTELIDSMENAEEDLSEINELLKKADNNEYIENDNADMPDILENLQDAQTKTEDAASTPKVKTKKNIFKKRKKTEQSEEIPDKKTSGLKSLFGKLGKQSKAKSEESAVDKISTVPDNSDFMMDADMAAEAEVAAFMDAFDEATEAPEEALFAETTQGQEIDPFGEVPDGETLFAETTQGQEVDPFGEAPDGGTLFAETTQEQEIDPFGEVPDGGTLLAEMMQEQEAALFADGIEDISEVIPEKVKKKPKEKKPGLLTRILAYLSQEDEEEAPGEENEEILEQLAKEDEKAAKAKEKKQKKAEKKEQKEKAKKEKDTKSANDEKKLEKQRIKEEKKRAKAEKAPEQPGKKLMGKKAKILFVAFCTSLIAAVFSLSTFLPEYVDKQNAKEAFYIGDYENVYKLLYGKSLNAHDQLLLDRARAVLVLERKLEAYENNKTLGKEMEALDALIKGVVKYGKLERVDEIGARAEVDSLYAQICGILLNNYGLTPENVLEIYSLDDIPYTETLQELINGESYGQQQLDDVEKMQNHEPQDLLPEEEEMIGAN